MPVNASSENAGAASSQSPVTSLAGAGNSGAAIITPTSANETVIEIPSTSMASARRSSQDPMFLYHGNGEAMDATPSGSTGTPNALQRNLLSIFSRTQLGRQTSMPNQDRLVGRQHDGFESMHVPGHGIMRANSETGALAGQGPNRRSLPNQYRPLGYSRYVRSSWRNNLNNVLSFSSSPSTSTLRSLITHSGNFRYSPLGTEAAAQGDTAHLLAASGDQEQDPPNGYHHGEHSSASNGRLSNSLRDPTATELPVNTDSALVGSLGSAPAAADNDSSSILGQFRYRDEQPEVPAGQNAAAAGGGGGEADPQNAEDENNVISDMAVQMLGHVVRYIPIVCIIFLKFIHDHFLGILDIVWLHALMYHANKSLRQQVAKYSQKSYGILLRDCLLVAIMVSYRLAVCSVPPDPFGLLVNIPDNLPTTYDMVVSKDAKAFDTDPYNLFKGFSNARPSESVVTLSPKDGVADELLEKVRFTKSLSLGILLYYVTVNDLLLKLLTILLKQLVTFLSASVVRHKPRARIYVFIEYFSQFYRSVAPMHQWYIYLTSSYAGLEWISGMIFLVLYFGAKVFEFTERGKSLKNAFLNVVRNKDYERKPTKDELDAAGTVCPICHDSYNSPVVLNCSHIFCDDCVTTWFKREQTCPMCRAKVSEDPTWQDGSTTFFFQLC